MFNFDALYQRWLTDEQHDTQPSRTDFIRSIEYDLDAYAEAFEDLDPSNAYYGGRAELSYAEACFVAVSDLSD